MSLKKFFITSALSTLMLVAAALPSFASAAGGVAGTWSVVDRGPGAWAGGTLNQDGTANGSGSFAYKAANGQEEVALIDAVSWSLINPTTISLCVNITGLKGPDFPVGVTVSQCIPLAVSGHGAPVPSLFDPDTYAKVMLK